MRTPGVVLCDHCSGEVDPPDVQKMGIGFVDELGTAQGVRCELCKGCARELLEVVAPFCTQQGIDFLRSRDALKS